MEELNFEVGREYKIRLYPRENVVAGRYIEDNDIHHLFECSDESVIRVNKHFALLEKGVLTHSSISSFAILKSRTEGDKL